MRELVVCLLMKGAQRLRLRQREIAELLAVHDLRLPGGRVERTVTGDFPDGQTTTSLPGMAGPTGAEPNKQELSASDRPRQWDAAHQRQGDPSWVAAA